MIIDESRKLLLSDTLIPDIFITEYLPSLSGLAVKLYIYLLLAVRSNKDVSEQDLARRMGVEEEAVKTALLELSSCELLRLQDNHIHVEDIKAIEIDRIYRPKTSSAPSEAIAAQEKFSVREKLMADISKTFFQGLMSPSWYGEIDTWFDRFRFEPEVIYTLFQECARRHKLDSKAYIIKVAENWSQRGIVSYQDLNQYFLAYDKVNKISKMIARKLRKTMTAYDEEIVSRWVEKMGYDFEIIELALRKTVKLANPNLAYIDRILEEWFSHQLRAADQIKQYEEGKSARYKNSKTGYDKTHKAKAGNVGNFAQRQYSDDYLQGFYENVDHAQPDDEQEKEDKQ